MSKSVEVPQPRYMEDEPEGLTVDESACQMGANCCFEPPRPIGFYLDEDDHGGGGVRWNYTFRLPDGRLVCEDCAVVFDEYNAPAPERRPDPRNNADDAYVAFMSMGTDEWKGLFRSVALGGGALQVEEDKGYKRALAERGLT